MSFTHVFFRNACVERTGALSRRSRTFPHSHRALLGAHRNVAEASDVNSGRHDRVHLLRYPGEFVVAQRLLLFAVSFFNTAVYVRFSLSAIPALAYCPGVLPLLAALACCPCSSSHRVLVHSSSSRGVSPLTQLIPSFQQYISSSQAAEGEGV